MRITKKAIAEYLGISRTAVSLALNNAPNSTLSEETRERILKTAKELGYKGMIESNKICYILYNREGNDPRYLFDLRNIEEAASKRGYNILFMSVKPDVNSLKKVKKIANSGEVFAILLTGLIDAEIIYTLDSVDVPYVVYGFSDKKNINIVIPDAVKEGYEATKYLIKFGHKKIAFLSGKLDMLVHKQRLEGYKLALKEEGIAFDPALVQASANEDSYEMIERMEILNIKYSAILCANTVVQFKAVQCLKEKGYGFPGEISVIGCLYTELVDLCNPPLAAVATNHAKSADIIIEALADVVKNKNSAPKTTYLTDIKIITGGTVSTCKE